MHCTLHRSAAVADIGSPGWAGISEPLVSAMLAAPS